MKIQVLGTGCPKCKKTAEAAEGVVKVVGKVPAGDQVKAMLQ
jgi:hypothetical protein